MYTPRLAINHLSLRRIVTWNVINRIMENLQCNNINDLYDNTQYPTITLGHSLSLVSLFINGLGDMSMIGVAVC